MPESPVAFYPAALAEHSVESLYAAHGRGRPWIYWIALAGVVVGLGALPLVQVDLTVRSPGLVRPATERTELKAPVSARIGRVLARDNEHVAAGQPLVELAARDTEERLARNRSLQAERSAMMADLTELTARLHRLEAVTDPAGAGSIALLQLATPSLVQLYDEFRSHWESGGLALNQARAVAARTEALAAKGLVTAQEAENARYACSHALADRQLLVQQTLSTWETRLREELTQQQQLESDEKRLREELALATLRAPVAGTVQGLVGMSPGTFVVAGQSLGAISPDDRLLVETLVADRDIGLVRVGQPVRLQVDAFPYTQWGMLEGTVLSLAADATASGPQAAFKVCVRPAALALRSADGNVGTLRKGMTVAARFVVARRSLLEILYQDTSKWFDPRLMPGST